MTVWTKKMIYFFFSNTKQTTLKTRQSCFIASQTLWGNFFFSFGILSSGSKLHVIYHSFCCSNNSLDRLQRQKHPDGLTTLIWQNEVPIKKIRNKTIWQLFKGKINFDTGQSSESEIFSLTQKKRDKKWTE